MAHASISVYMFNSKEDMYSSSSVFIFDINNSGDSCLYIQFPKDMCIMVVKPNWMKILS